MQIIVSDLLTQYDRSGKGPIVLIVPGWADTSRSWTQIAQALESAYDVVIMNLPGFGGSQKPPYAWGLQEYAEFVGMFLKKLLKDDNIHIVIGHSNGGSLAIKALAAGNIRADKLVLVASAGIRNQQSSKKLSLKILAKSGKVLSSPLPPRIRRRIRQSFYTSTGSDMLVAEHMQETFKKIVSEDIQSDAAKIKIPTLLIYGDQDQETPVKFGQIYQSIIAESKLKIVPEAGHFLHTEHGPEVVGYIREFVK